MCGFDKHLCLTLMSICSHQSFSPIDFQGGPFVLQCLVFVWHTIASQQPFSSLTVYGVDSGNIALHWGEFWFTKHSRLKQWMIYSKKATHMKKKEYGLFLFALFLTDRRIRLLCYAQPSTLTLPSLLRLPRKNVFGSGHTQTINGNLSERRWATEVDDTLPKTSK